MSAVRLIPLFAVCVFFATQAALAQSQLPPLANIEQRDLRLIAEEAVAAKIAGRPSREPKVGARLQARQGLVVSIYLGDELVGRSWQLRNPMPLYEGAKTICNWAMEEPKGDLRPIHKDDLPNVTVKITALSNYAQVDNDSQVPPRTAVIIYHGFKEGVALPEDLPPNGTAADLIGLACVSAGLRNNSWLLPNTSIFIASTN